MTAGRWLKNAFNLPTAQITQQRIKNEIKASIVFKDNF